MYAVVIEDITVAQIIIKTKRPDHAVAWRVVRRAGVTSQELSGHLSELQDKLPTDLYF